MTRMNPLRRLAATAAIVGITGFGAVALAGPALADETAPATTSVSVEAPAPAASPLTMSELIAGLFSKEKSIGNVDLSKIDAPTDMTSNDLMAILHSTANPSPLPQGAVQMKVGSLKFTFSAPVAQKVQTIVANFYAAQGYQIAYNAKGVLVIGKRICDDSQSKDWNKGCVKPQVDSRF
jgi:hypothetical protein